MAAALDKEAIIWRRSAEQEKKVKKMFELFMRDDVDHHNSPYIIRQFVNITIEDCFAAVAKDIGLPDHPMYNAERRELKKEVAKQLSTSFIEFCNNVYQL